MALVPLDLKAGFYRNGTDLDAANRWRDGSLVRWRDGSLRPIGGWQEFKDGFATNPVRGAHAWESLGGTSYFAGGSYNELKAMTGGGTIYNITPTVMSAGREDAAQNLGFSGGFFGTGFFGTARPATGIYSEATSWALDNYGQFLVGVHYDTGTLVEWQLGSSAVAAPVTNAPLNNLGLVVTEERFIFLLGAGGNPRKVQWCDKEANTVWTAAATNEAGDFTLQTSGQIMQGLKTRGQTLILTDSDAFAAKYLGPPYVYGFDRVGTSCGAVSRMSAVDTDMGTFWMGQKGFFGFDGNSVKEIPCEVHDYVFDDINVNQQSKIWAFSNSEFSEVWWFYPSEDSLEIDRYVAFDLLENHWLIGNLSRTGGVSRGIFRSPYLAGHNSDTDIYAHENGLNYDGSAIFCETGPISIGAGDQISKVTEVIPDEKTQGDVDLKFKTRFYPNATETTHGPFNPSNPTSVRFSGRQIRMRVDGVQAAAWRFGTMRLETKAGGRR